MWDEYIPNSLKANTQTKIVTSARRRVLLDLKVPGNWQSILRLEEKQAKTFQVPCGCAHHYRNSMHHCQSIGNSNITNGNYDLSFLAPSNQEEADTRMLLHAKEASQSGIKKVLIRTLDTDVVAISIGLLE